MGVLDTIKDWLGILDDADDFAERSVKIRTKLDRILSLVVDGGKFLSGRLKPENLQKPSDFRFLVQFIRSTTGRKGEINRLLARDLKDVEELIRKAQKVGISDVLPNLQALKSDIKKAILQNRDMFKELDLVTRAFARIQRSENVKAVGRIVVGALISFTSAAVVMQLVNRNVTHRLDTLETATGLARKNTPTEG